MSRWWRSYRLLLLWRVLRIKAELPMFVILQTAFSVGIIFGFSYLLPPEATHPDFLMYLATGSITMSIITIGMVIAPQGIATGKQDGTLDYDKTLPVPRMAIMMADVSIWSLASLPGLVAAFVLAGLRLDISFQVSPLLLPAILLVMLASTAVGFGLAYAFKPMVTLMVTQLLVFFILMFSPVNFPADRLPEWLQAVHRALPIEPMAEIIRTTLSVPAGGVSPTPFLLVGVWCVLGLVITYRVMARRV
ncbi:ABC transporter permease [Sphaerisporangium sp. B11E5]|uniref:ABC transporter permease n=1 Tax=Sphaerisporangium sp. B11E5 TaxID=3153563 RepID=UPI00325D0486